MISLAERLPVTVTPHAVGQADAAGDNHIDLHLVGQTERLLHQQAVEAFQGTSVVAGLAHGQHKRLYGQGTTLVHHDADITLRYLPHDRTAEADQLDQEFTHQAQQAEAARVEKRHQLAIVIVYLLDTLLLLLLRAVAPLVVLLKQASRLSVLLVEVLTRDKDHHLLRRARRELVETSMGKGLEYRLVCHVVGFPQLHVGTRGRQRGHLDTVFHPLRVERLARVIVPHSTPVVKYVL